MFMRHFRPLNKWLRAVTITFLLIFDLVLAIKGRQDPVPIGDFSPCGYCALYISPDDLYRVWYKLATAAMVVTLTEVVYTLYRRYRDPPPMPSKPETIIVVSPEQYQYGIQPNMTIPYGTAQPQPYLLQQQPVYPQPVYPNFAQPYPPPIQPATILSPQQQAILQNQSSLKHEDSSQIIQLHQ
ncbi:hypothetical protein BGZ88_000154 [Linnemannia elongata]|nr:hypothetical protein BGZ88_000154 [Linnemannia elongata]